MIGGAFLSRLPALLVWLPSGVLPSVTVGREVAQEGSASLEVGLPFPPSIVGRKGSRMSEEVTSGSTRRKSQHDRGHRRVAKSALCEAAGREQQRRLSPAARHRVSARSGCWAVEGAAGVGRQLAQRLVADGEQVLDVPAKLSVRARISHRSRPQDRPGRRAHRRGRRAAQPGLAPVAVDERRSRCDCCPTAAGNWCAPTPRR